MIDIEKVEATASILQDAATARGDPLLWDSGAYLFQLIDENKQLRKELNRAKGIKDVPALLKGTDD